MPIDKLRNLPPFSSFDEEVLSNLESVSTLCEYEMGQSIINNIISDSVCILVNGEVRHLVDSSDESAPFTLNLYSPPYVAGFPSLLAGHPVEFLSAASHCHVLKVPKSDWLHFLDTNDSAGNYFYQKLYEADVWPLVQLQSNLIKPSGKKELRSWLKTVTKSSIALTFGSLKDFKSAKKYHWFVASSASDSFSYGDTLNQSIFDSLNLSLNDKLRVIGIPIRFFESSNSFSTNVIQSFSLDSTVDATDSYSKQSDSLPKQVVLPPKKVNSSSTSLVVNSENFHPKEEIDPSETKYRFFSSGPSSVEEAVACFRTIGHLLNLPIKTDLLRRVFSEQVSQDDGTISLQLAAAIGESLGLQSQLLDLPCKFINRLQVPALVHLSHTELAVILDISDSKLLIARPQSAIQSLSLEHFQTLVENDGSFPVLLLRTTHRTPQKRFGFAWFLPAISKNKKPLIEVLVASLFVQLFQLMNPLIVQQIIDKVIGQNGMSTFRSCCSAFLFSTFENVLTAVRTNLFIETTNRIDLSLGEQVIDHLLRLPLSYFDKRPVGELSSRLSELEQIRSFLTGTALTVVLDSVFSIIYIVVMIFYSWILTIVALIVAPLLALLTFSTSPVIRKQIRTKAELNAKTQNHLVEILTGIQTVKAQNFELKARWRWKQRYSKYVAESFKNAVTSTTTNGLSQFLNQSSTLSILCVGAYLVLEGQLTLGQLIAFRIISGYVTGPLLRLSNLYQNFQQTSIALERLADIVDTPQESTEIDRKNIPLPLISGGVRYENISFRFGKSGPLQLSQVNIDIPAGEFVAIVGQSGSGKSTLTKLLPRLYEPLSGRILVDETDNSKVELYSFRRQIGIVPQDSLLFEGSVQDNISLSNPEATSEEVISAAKIASAHEFIMGLPQGYASSVGERGGGLSGGQRQRIAIARTVLQNPRLLIMDEATSALDYETERMVSLNLMEHFRGRTVLFITHRLSSIIHADRIILMYMGQVEEQGTHAELMQMRGRYYALFRQQESTQV